MTLRDFNCMSEVGKDEAVCLKGDYLKEDIVPGYRIVLYKIDNFFVEVYYEVRANVIKKFKGCTRSDLLYAG